MDQESATIWASGFGVFGTLAGALGGAYLQRRAAVEQVREQEGADIRSRLREERRVAFASVLTHSQTAITAANPVLPARNRPGWQTTEEGRALPDDQNEMWLPVETEVLALQSAATTIAVTGPDDMADLATKVYMTTARRGYIAFRSTAEGDELVEELKTAMAEIQEARAQFIKRAQIILTPPER